VWYFHNISLNLEVKNNSRKERKVALRQGLKLFSNEPIFTSPLY
jgi:hypothetical protein